MMPVQINKHHCMARKGRLKGFQTAYGLCCNLKPMRAQCMRSWQPLQIKAFAVVLIMAFDGGGVFPQPAIGEPL